MGVNAPGIIIFTKGSGWTGWLCRHAVNPPSDGVHAFIIRQYIPLFDDYEIEESVVTANFIPKGISHNLMYQHYQGASVEIYKVPDSVCSPQDQEDAPIELLQYGDDAYDFMFYIKMFAQVPGIWLRMLFQEHKLRKFKPEDFTYNPGNTSTAICTRAVWLAYMAVGLPLVPPDVPPLPNAYMEARDQGLLELLYKGVL